MNKLIKIYKGFNPVIAFVGAVIIYLTISTIIISLLSGHEQSYFYSISDVELGSAIMLGAFAIPFDLFLNLLPYYIGGLAHFIQGVSKS